MNSHQSPRNLAIRGRFLAAAACVFLLAGFTARAELQLDQSYDPRITFSSGTAPGFTAAYAQTFTVGIGGRLNRFDVRLYRDDGFAVAPVRWELRHTFDGLPLGGYDAPVLASGLISPTSVPGTSFESATFVSVDSSPFKITVNPGDMFAIVLKYSGYEWGGSFVGELYPGGSAFDTVPTGESWFANPPGDFAFRTYVNVIPEPSTIHLALFSLGAALLRRLRKT